MKELIFSTAENTEFEELVDQQPVPRWRVSEKDNLQHIHKKELSRADKYVVAPPKIDLHGYTREEALRRTQHFIASCKRRKDKSILIIVGKGNNSGNAGPVLKKAVEEYLRSLINTTIKSFRMAPRKQGGEGAFLVRL